MYSPLRYPGGKGQVYDVVLSALEDNNLLNCTYIEPFAGGAGIAIRLLFENKVKKIIINDFDRSIYAVWYCILYYNDEFIKLIQDTPVNMSEWYIQKEVQINKESSDILSLGFSTFFLNRTNRSGIIKAGVIGGKNQNGNYKMDCRFNKEKLIELIKKIYLYRDKIEIYNLEAQDFIKYVKKRKKQFYFIDPPYYNNGRQLYTNFFNEEHHKSLKSFLSKNMKNKKFIVSYDDCEEIKELYKKYNQTIVSLNYSLERKKKSNEIFITNNISFNYNECK